MSTSSITSTNEQEPTTEKEHVMTSTGTAEGHVDAKEALRAAAHRTATKAEEADDALAGLEHDLRAREDSIAAHHAAIATHKQELVADKTNRTALTAAVAQQRKRVTQAAKHASKAGARYDKVVLAQLVIDAKNADQPATAPAVKRAPAKKAAPRKVAPAKIAASPTTPAGKTAPAGKTTPARTAPSSRKTATADTPGSAQPE